MPQRRGLLAMAIRRVVVVPWPGGGQPQRGTRRELRIDWAPSVIDKDRSVLVAEQIREPAPRRRVSAGRSEMMRDLERDKRDAASERRSRIARDYFSSWKEVCDRLKNAP